jgi:hypothetical protein
MAPNELTRGAALCEEAPDEPNVLDVSVVAGAPLSLRLRAVPHVLLLANLPEFCDLKAVHVVPLHCTRAASGPVRLLLTTSAPRTASAGVATTRLTPTSEARDRARFQGVTSNPVLGETPGEGRPIFPVPSTATRDLMTMRSASARSVRNRLSWSAAPR